MALLNLVEGVTHLNMTVYVGGGTQLSLIVCGRHSNPYHNDLL